MSVQFGRWNFDGQPLTPEYLAKVDVQLAPHGPDDSGSYCKEGTGIVYRAFHATKESRCEPQPYIMPSGAVLCWDGRLDNRVELARLLDDDEAMNASDIEIVSAAYERWQDGCFPRLIGDWSLSIWNPISRYLVLAKDPVGTRHLYYAIENTHITWSTVLDPLVLLSDKSFTLCEEYLAGWFAFFPSAHLTPYVGIQSVPPSTRLLIRPGKFSASRYWDFDAAKRVHYRTDGEYEEHFRTAFAEAVRRRLRSDNPILAELSGGMDSSSIVCMADAIIGRGAAETPRLDTVSYYNDSEPNWDERPYFTRVEKQRGRSGTHINVGAQEPYAQQMRIGQFAATPAYCSARSGDVYNKYRSCLESNGNRVVLSGIGGDEVCGGVPTPQPDLQDLIAQANVRQLAHQLKVWALEKRKPWFHLFLEALREFFPPGLVGVARHRRPIPWLSPDFIDRNKSVLRGYQKRLRLFGPLPSFQRNLATLNALRRQLECSPLVADMLCEKRYPYLDRDLLEFLYAVPNEQLVRPGHRRSLMRRALVGIVPSMILDRKRKAFVARSTMVSISTEYEYFSEMGKNLVSDCFGAIDAQGFDEALESIRQGKDVPLAPFLRTITLGTWLQNLRSHGFANLERKSSWSSRWRSDKAELRHSY